jgi:hypothetical protein
MVDRGVLWLLGLSTSYSLAALILVALRFAGVVSWPWLWVLCPLWIPVVLTSIAFAGLMAMLGRVDSP